jgi:hypothetical protein
MAHMHSWFHYRQRDALRGHPNSTLGLTFAEFLEARLSPAPPPFAALGRQDRFLGFLDDTVPVTHIFDHADLSRLVAFLQDRLGARLALDARNISPGKGSEIPDLPPALRARYEEMHAGEFALYARVAKAGHLITRA